LGAAYDAVTLHDLGMAKEKEERRDGGDEAEADEDQRGPDQGLTGRLFPELEGVA